MARIFRQSPSYYSMLSGHIGLSLMVIGIAATSVSSIELDVRMAPGESVSSVAMLLDSKGFESLRDPTTPQSGARFW